MPTGYYIAVAIIALLVIIEAERIIRSNRELEEVYWHLQQSLDESDKKFEEYENQTRFVVSTIREATELLRKAKEIDRDI